MNLSKPIKRIFAIQHMYMLNSLILNQIDNKLYFKIKKINTDLLAKHYFRIDNPLYESLIKPVTYSNPQSITT